MSIDDIIWFILLSPILLGVMIGTVLSFKGNNKKNNKLNTPLVNIAVLYIEEGYDILQKFSLATNCLRFMKSKDGGFKIEILLDEQDLSLAKCINGLNSNWKICQNDSFLQFTYNITYSGSWSCFENQVWIEVSRKHPTWKHEGSNLYKDEVDILNKKALSKKNPIQSSQYNAKNGVYIFKLTQEDINRININATEDMLKNV